MKKCYIAGMIGTLSEDQYKSNFHQAKKEVQALGMIPVSPLDLPHEHGRSWGEYMREDIKAMLECDAVYCLNNWRKSPGATIEINLAIAVGLNIYHQPMPEKK